MTTKILSYAAMSLQLRASEELIAALEHELSPFFRLAASGDGNPIGMIVAHQDGLPSHYGALLEGDSEPVAVDTSLYAHLQTNGRRWTSSQTGVTLFQFERTGTYTLIVRARDWLEVFQPSPELLLRDTIRLIKTLFTLAVEKNGGLQIHASGAVDRDGKAILIIGDMWQGKTTLPCGFGRGP